MRQETLAQHFKDNPDCELRLFYDQWKCPNSTEKTQIKVPPAKAKDLMRDFGEFLYDGAYTTGFTKDGEPTIDVWAQVVGNKRYKYPETINPKDVVKTLFTEATKDEESLCPLEEEFDNQDNVFGYFDEDNGYLRIYHYEDTVESIEKRILLDEQAERFIDKEALAAFLIKYADPNALMCMEYLAFVYDANEEEKSSEIRNLLEEEYGDEYAQYIAEDEGQIGCTWVERQIPVINISNMMQSSLNIADSLGDFPEDIFVEGLLSTIFHELRHLFYECNEIVEIGDGTPYPEDGGVEDEVEEYCRNMTDQYLSEFKNTVLDTKALEQVIIELEQQKENPYTK